MCSSTWPAVELASATPSPLEMSASTCEVRSRYSSELATPLKLSSICPRRASLKVEAPWRKGTGRLRRPHASIATHPAGNLLHVIAEGRRGGNPAG